MGSLPVERRRASKDRKDRRRTAFSGSESRSKRSGETNPAYNLRFTTEVVTRSVTPVTAAKRSGGAGVLLPAMEARLLDHGALPAGSLDDRGYFNYRDIEALESIGLVKSRFIRKERTLGSCGKIVPNITA